MGEGAWRGAGVLQQCAAQCGAVVYGGRWASLSAPTDRCSRARVVLKESGLCGPASCTREPAKPQCIINWPQPKQPINNIYGAATRSSVSVQPPKKLTRARARAPVVEQGPCACARGRMKVGHALGHGSVTGTGIARVARCGARVAPAARAVRRPRLGPSV
eukprot:scaffold16826_cov36-Phaeocystis_antarctica.AAC.1